MNSKGKLYLIPTRLGDNAPLEVLPISVKKIIELVDYYIVENEKTARRFIKKISGSKSQQNLKIHLLNKYTESSELPGYLDACLEGKQPTVIDNTNPTKEDREKYIKGFKENRFEVLGYYFASKLNDCLERNAAREGKDRIPDVGIKATYNKLELPEYSEGFDKLFYVSASNDGFDVKEWNNEV